METNSTTIQMLKAKDIKTFELVFKQYYGELCGFATKYVEDADIAEELVQSLFCSLWEKLDSIGLQTNLKAYLYTGVRNAAFNHFKHQKVVDKYEQYASNTGASISPPSEVLEVKELKSIIDLAMNLLPEKCRQVFELSRIEQKKYREIAEELNISIKTVEIHMGKALKILRQELGSYLPLAILIWTYMINK
ncbi:MAG: RNA polymerase sigma-70 factor (ECF subfamily) [bacterium]|jgi:RNA polymerase sigma-70 factor (ECF subfamily)